MSGETGRRKKNGQFAAETPRDPYALYQLLRVVAVKAAAMVNALGGPGSVPVEPQKVTEDAWNKAAEVLEATGEFGKIPRAGSIRKQLPDRDGQLYPWPELLELVFDERNVERVHMERQGVLDDRYVGEEAVYYALNRVARALSAPTINRIEYEAVRGMLVKADKRRPNGGHLEALMPTLGQIEHFVERQRQQQLDAAAKETGSAGSAAVAGKGSGGDSGTATVVASEDSEMVDNEGAWDLALAIADLEPRPVKPNVVRDRVPLMEAILRFHAVVTRLPSANKLRQFARDFNFAAEDAPTGRPWVTDVLAEAREKIRSLGLPDPPPWKGSAERLTWEVPEVSPWPDDPPYRPEAFWTHAMVLTTMVDFRDWLGRGQHPSVTAYTEFSWNDETKPSMQVISDHGGLDALFEELADPAAIDNALRELNPTAGELARRQEQQRDRKLEHPTPQAILRVITERDEAGAREIEAVIGLDKGSANVWLNLFMEAGRIETTTPSRVAKNVKYCLAGHAPTLEEGELRRLKAKAETPNSQAAFKLIRENPGITMRELAERLGRSPELVAKWVRPLKALGLVEQIVESLDGKKRTWYRAMSKTDGK